MHWPQIIWVAVVMIGVGVSLARHGTPVKADTHNALTDLVGYATGAALLYWGGWFNVWL